MKRLLLIALALILCLGVLAACDEPTTPPAGDTPGTQETPGGGETPTPGDGTPPTDTSTTEDKTAVPESLVLRNVSLDENTTYIMTHNYDAATHIDDVTLVTVYAGNYGTRTQTYIYSYQYDRSSDLWSLIGGKNGLQSDVVSFDPESFIGKTFEGSYSQADSGQYSIQVTNLDLKNEKITVKYSISVQNYGLLSKTEILSIFPFSDGSGYGFEIHYTRSMVVRYFITFTLDLNKGIYA